VKARTLAVDGAVEFTPQHFPDQRGLFVSPFQEPAFAEMLDRPLFPVAQTSFSRSRRGVVRGVHYTRTPPGMARYVFCPNGRALDFVVDVRVGSPTFGRWDSVELDQESFRAVYLPVGVGHAFVALEDDTVMCYLLARSYDGSNEHSISVFDPTIGLWWPDGAEPVLSDRDREAPSLAEARDAGTLPDYRACLEIESGQCIHLPEV
jgi:5-epimerase